MSQASSIFVGTSVSPYFGVIQGGVWTISSPFPYVPVSLYLMSSIGTSFAISGNVPFIDTEPITKREPPKPTPEEIAKANEEAKRNKRVEGVIKRLGEKHES